MRLLLLALGVLLAVAAPAAARAETIAPAPLPNARVGEIPGTHAFVGVSEDHGAIRAYVCDGTPKRKPTISQWFSGRGRTLRAGGHVLKLHGRTGSFDGHRFTLRRAGAPAGLFQHKGDPVDASWIVLGDLRLRGTMVSTRKPCRFVLITGSNGQQQWVSVCN